MSMLPDAWGGDFERMNRWAHTVTGEYAGNLAQHPEMREQCEVALSVLRVSAAIRYFVDPPRERHLDRIASYIEPKVVA